MISAPLGPPAPDTLRTDQRLRRGRIVHAALRRLISSDYDNVKVSDVAKDSDVALGTVYRYFSSKEHLFAAAFVEWQDSFGRRIQQGPPANGSESERLQEFLGQTIRAFQVQPQFYRLLLVLQMTSDPYAAEIYVTLDQQFRKIFDAALGPGGERSGDRDAIFVTVEAVLNQSLGRWVTGRLSIEGVYRSVAETIRLIYPMS